MLWIGSLLIQWTSNVNRRSIQQTIGWFNTDCSSIWLQFDLADHLDGDTESSFCINLHRYREPDSERRPPSESDFKLNLNHDVLSEVRPQSECLGPMTAGPDPGPEPTPGQCTLCSKFKLMRQIIAWCQWTWLGAKAALRLQVQVEPQSWRAQAVRTEASVSRADDGRSGLWSRASPGTVYSTFPYGDTSEAAGRRPLRRRACQWAASGPWLAAAWRRVRQSLGDFHRHWPDY